MFAEQPWLRPGLLIMQYSHTSIEVSVPSAVHCSARWFSAVKCNALQCHMVFFHSISTLFLGAGFHSELTISQESKVRVFCSLCAVQCSTGLVHCCSEERMHWAVLCCDVQLVWCIVMTTVCESVDTCQVLTGDCWPMWSISVDYGPCTLYIVQRVVITLSSSYHFIQ